MAPCDDRRVSFLSWFEKPTPYELDVPEVGPKPFKDWTDDDLEARVWEDCKQVVLWEPNERTGSSQRLNYDELLADAFRLREMERRRCSRSRLSVGFSRIRLWLREHWREWRHPGESEDEGDVQIAVDLAGVTPVKENRS